MTDPRVEMVGRDAALRELGVLLHWAVGGRGRAAYVLGEAGMGKTTLVEAASARAAEIGMRVACGWSSAAEMPPFWPWRRLLRDLGDIEPDFAGSVPGNIDELDRDQLFASVIDALETEARDGPVLLVIEDLHWADVPSLLLLRSVIDALPSMPAALIVTCRDEPGEATAEVRAHLLDLPPGVRRVELAGLDASAVAELAARVSAGDLPEDIAQQLPARTGGNPFFVREVVRLLVAQGSGGSLAVPAGVREVLQRRLARLTQPCHALLGAAAVSGDPIDEVLVSAVTGVAEDTVVELLDEAVMARLVDNEPATGFAFAHALIREVLESGLSTVERSRLHTRVAEELERALAAEAGGDSFAHRLAYHWSHATGEYARARAAEWWWRAARTAVTELGYEQAVGYFRRSLAGPAVDRVQVLTELGQAQWLSGDVAGARTAYLEAASLAQASGRGEDMARAVLGLGGGVAGFEVRTGDQQQVDLLREADALLPAGDNALRAAVRGRLSLALAEMMTIADRVELAEQAVAMAVRCGDGRVEATVLAAYCDAVAGPDFAAERLTSAERIQALAEASGDRVTELLARRLRMVAQLELGKFAAVDEEVDAYRRCATAVGVPLYLWLPEMWTGMRALLSGDAVTALRRARRVQEVGARAGSQNAALMAFTLRMHAHRTQGTALQMVAEVRRLMAEVDLPDRPTYLAGPAWLLLEAGEPDDARAVLRRFLAMSPDQMPKDAEWVEAHQALGEIAVALGHRDAAERLFNDLRPYEHLWGVDGIGAAVIGLVGHQLGNLAALLDRHHEAVGYLRAARDAYLAAGASLLARRADEELAALGASQTTVVDQARARPSPGPILAGRLRRDGQLWHVTWGERESVVRDAKGIRDLAQLLAHPRRPIAALDLVEGAGGPEAAAAGTDLGPVLDATARRAYRMRLVELEEEIAQAESDADLGRGERLRAEQSMIAEELGGALGLGGRPRVAGDPVERARKAVTMRVRAAIMTIESVDPALAQHLRNAVKTGRFCAYEPESNVSWRT